MRFGKPVWYAKRTNEINATIPEYEEPIKLVTRANYLSVMPSSTRGFVEVLQSGENLYNSWVAIANSRAFDGVFSVGDVMWIDGEMPIAELEQEFGNGVSATAVIESVAEANLYITLHLKRNQKQQKQ